MLPMIESYKNLIVWQKSTDLVEEIYKLTRQFPKEELFGLVTQMRRAAVSIPSNIAEGSKRKDIPEYLQFLRIADASSAELETQIIISKKIYSEINCKHAEVILTEVQKMLSGLLKKLKEKNLKPETYHLKPNSGFTLIELLVAIGIFATLTAVAMGGLAREIRVQRQTQELIAVSSNASLVLEQMAREIRTGSYFCHKDLGSDNPPVPHTPGTYDECGPPVGTGTSNFSTAGTLVFWNAHQNKVAYCLAADPVTGVMALRRSEVKSGSITCDGGSHAVTGDNVTITSLTFYLHGNQDSDGYPPRITVVITARPNTTEPELGQSDLHLETTVSARLIDT